jgi:hypothetical protein
MFLDCSKFASLGYFGPFLTATLGVLSLAGIFLKTLDVWKEG